MTGDADTRSRRRARKGDGELLRGEILDAAEALLVERGHPEAVSMRAIADRVGVTPPSIYLHFADKEQLFFESCIRRFAELDASLATLLAGSDLGVLEQLRAIGRGYMQFALGKAELYATMMIGGIPASLDAEVVRQLPGVSSLGAVARILEAGMAQGVVRSDIDPAAAAASMWGACHGTVMVLVRKRENRHLPMPDDEQAIVETTLDLLIGGLRTQPDD